jgi:Flp pilus assembly protein TadD
MALELRGTVSAVREGMNGRLFLGEQDGFILDLFTSGDPFPPNLLARWRATLARRAREMAARGIPYVFFIVPDAPSVHPEDLPAEVQRGFRTPGEVFLEAMGDIPGVTFVYPLRAMQQACGGLDIYKKKDSHWTTYGSYIAYRELMRAVQDLVPCRVVPARDLRFTFRRSYGDLGSLTDPEQAEDVPAHSIDGPGTSTIVSMEGVGRQTGTETHALADLPPCRALFFRDSYMTDLSPYLARSFAQFLTLGTTTRVLLDAVDDWKANLVVSQVAERKLFFCESDHQLDGYHTIYGGSFRNPAGARLLKALLLVREDPAEAARLVADDGQTLAADPVQAYSAALIHEANGDLVQAARFAAAAVALQPDQPSFLALAGRISLGLGRLEEAVGLTAEAAGLAPYNGYFRELHIYTLVQAHDVPGALAVAEAALERVTDSANLWYWASVCHDALGHGPEALARITQALRLSPADPAYMALRDKLAEHAG